MASVLMFREREEVPMAIVGGLDIHRQQLTFDYVDMASGEVCRGRVVPADRAGLAAWLRRFEGVDEVVFAVGACTGWGYVGEELAAAGVGVVLAEPADTAAARGPKRRAKDRSGGLAVVAGVGGAGAGAAVLGAAAVGVGDAGVAGVLSGPAS